MLALSLDLARALEHFARRSPDHQSFVRGIMTERGMCANRFAASRISEEVGLPLGTARKLLSELRHHITERGIRT